MQKYILIYFKYTTELQKKCLPHFTEYGRLQSYYAFRSLQ
jgi:hypothetical protein